VSPIFVRPVREQLEHDRLIRFLQTKYKRKYEALINVGDEQVAPVKIGANTFWPDVVLMDGKKLAGLVEVESGESVNNLEAMAQWVHFSRARVPFHLYVPVHAVDAARRFCLANDARVSEVWTYRAAMDGFDLVRAFHDPGAATARHAARPNQQAPKPTASKAAPAKPAASAKSGAASRGKAKPAKKAAKSPAKAPARAKKARPAKPAKRAVKR
jgi:hypothetical protein